MTASEPSSGPASAPEPPGAPSCAHYAPRLFIGPLPEKLLPTMHEMMHVTRNTDGSFDASYVSAVRDVLDRNALAFFLRQGGRAEDWDDTTRHTVRDELTKRWQDCPWTRSIQYATQHGASQAHWVGATFGVGCILDVNLLDNHAPTSVASSVVPEAPPPQDPNPLPPHASTTALSSIGPRSFWTARSHISPIPSPPPSAQGSSSTTSLPEQYGGELAVFSSGSPLLATASAPSFPTGHAPQQGIDAPRSILKHPTEISYSRPRTKRRGVLLLERSAKRGLPRVQLRSEINPSRGVDARRLPLVGEQVDERPASPTAVLARTGNEVIECSAGATAEGTASEVAPGDVFLRDRMLVRVSYTKAESLPVPFDEERNRETTRLRHEDWREFLVVWRGDVLELYEDYTIPGREYITGHKRLAFLIPLASDRTRVSLYSFVDLTFCVLCPPTPTRNSKARTVLRLSKEGTNVFVFKHKSRTRARDWLWHLCDRLWGKILDVPPTIKIYCPDVDMHICIDVPMPDHFNLDAAYNTFSRRNIIDLIQRSLSSEPSSSVSRSWKGIIEREQQAGKKLEFAWRFDGQLDWEYHEQDIEGRPRPWGILSGLSLWQGTRPAQLELRIAEHFPDYVHLPNGKKMFEPPAVEGYLDRIRQQSRQRVYLVTHCGSLFSLLSSDANPPLPPSAHISRLMSGLKPSVEEYTRELFESEIRRGAEQICIAQGTLDLNYIRTVRRAYGPLAQDNDEHIARDEVDEQDVGGHEHTHLADRAQLHLRRAFDVVLASGTTIRYQAHSARDCIEWVTRLRALVTYWSAKHHVDIKEEMDVAFTMSTARLTPRIPKCHHGNEHSTPMEPLMTFELPVLKSLYTWCPLSSCRSIVKAGKVFMRKGLRGQYQLVQLFLVNGRLIRFNVSPTSTLHYRNSKEIGLLDAYVSSGYLAALALRSSEYSPESPNLPRRYHDGLETDEREEDELFVIQYRKTKVPVASEVQRPNAPVGGFRAAQPVPPLSRRSQKLVVFRTRSKVERDAWCWALGCEIERIVRSNMERERRVREAGGLVRVSS